MSNETTASQPILMAYVATDLDGHADVGLTIESAKHRAGPGCDTIIALHDISAQFVELEGKRVCEPSDVLSSQPKSIGDDAMREVIQDAVADNLTSLYLCSRHQSAWGAGTMGLDDFSPAGDSDDVITNITDAVMSAIHREINFRAPAAQASATIQAAPIGMPAAADLIDAKAQKYLDDHADTENDTGAVVFHYGEAGRDYHSSLVELAEEIRAIQPAGGACTVPPSGWHCTRAFGHAGACAAWRVAAPMVADPAGVALTDDQIRELWTESNIPSAENDHTTGFLLFARGVERAILAATVKAVPSEALEGCEHCLHTYCLSSEICRHCGDVNGTQGYKGRKLAAPLADKTGGAA